MFQWKHLALLFCWRICHEIYHADIEKTSIWDTRYVVSRGNNGVWRRFNTSLNEKEKAGRCKLSSRLGLIVLVERPLIVLQLCIFPILVTFYIFQLRFDRLLIHMKKHHHARNYNYNILDVFSKDNHYQYQFQYFG